MHEINIAIQINEKAMRNFSANNSKVVNEILKMHHPHWKGYEELPIVIHHTFGYISSFVFILGAFGTGFILAVLIR